MIKLYVTNKCKKKKRQFHVFTILPFPTDGADGTHVGIYLLAYLGLAKTPADMSEYVDAVIDFMLQAVTHWLNMFKEYYNG